MRSATSERVRRCVLLVILHVEIQVPPADAPGGVDGAEEGLDALAALREAPGQRPGQPAHIAERDLVRRDARRRRPCCRPPIGQSAASPPAAKLKPAEVGELRTDPAAAGRLRAGRSRLPHRSAWRPHLMRRTAVVVVRAARRSWSSSLRLQPRRSGSGGGRGRPGWRPDRPAPGPHRMRCSTLSAAAPSADRPHVFRPDFVTSGPPEPIPAPWADPIRSLTWASGFRYPCTMALPKIISVDDHVVEPPHVWQTWLPQKWRERGPKVVDKRWGELHAPLGRQVRHGRGPRGRVGQRLVLRRRADLRPQEVRGHPAGVDHPRRPGQHRVRPHPDDDDGHHLRRHAQGLLGP